MPEHRNLHITSAFDGHPQFEELVRHIRATGGDDRAVAAPGSRSAFSAHPGRGRTRHAMRNDPAGPTAEEAEAIRRDRERTTRSLAWWAIGAVLALIYAPFLIALVRGNWGL